MAPWARIVAQILVGAGNTFAKAFAQAYQQAQHNSARGGVSKETANKILGRMSRMFQQIYFQFIQFHQNLGILLLKQ